MAKSKGTTTTKLRTNGPKRTSQGGINPKTSAMNRNQRQNYKKYRGQGK